MNGFLFIRKKGIITGPFPVRRIKDFVQKDILGNDDEVSEDKLNWESVASYFHKEPAKEPTQPESPGVVPTALPLGGGMFSNTVDDTNTITQTWDALELLRKKKATTVSDPPDNRSHLWAFSHLLCAMSAWTAHERALERRCFAVVWSALAYAVLAIFGPAMLFCGAYPALHGYLWIAAYAAAVFGFGVSSAFLVSGITVRLRHDAWNRRIVTTAAMTLLAHFTTLFGTMAMLLHGVRHPHVWARGITLLSLLLAVGAFSAGSRQVLLGMACPTGGICHRRGALWVWTLWMGLTFLGFSFFSFFALGLL